MAMTDERYVGTSVPRKEDAELISGQGRFVDDIRLPGMLYMAFVRSPLAHATLGAIDTKRALAVPGVQAVFVRIWGAGEHVYDGHRADPLYRPDPSSATYIQQLAVTTGGVAVDAGDFGNLVKAVRTALGHGPTQVLRNEQRRLELAPYFAGFAFLPLGFLVWRRNLVAL